MAIDLKTRAQKFPEVFVKAAQEAQRQTGCLSSVTLAQWALESGYGKYLSAPFNYFGIKWHSRSKYGFKEKRTQEVYNGKWVTISAKFVAYPSLEEAFSHHGRLLTAANGPYAKAKPYLKDWKKFIQTIGPVYATDPKYVEKLISIVEAWRLYDFDVLPPKPAA